MVELLHALAWAVEVSDAARARVSKNSEIRNFKVSLQNYFQGRDQISTSGCTIA
jgi:hypothetical protein